MNKTRYKIATLTGSAVMAAMLLSLLILNIVCLLYTSDAADEL